MNRTTLISTLIFAGLLLALTSPALAATTTIDDFEDGDISEYNGDTGSGGVSTSTVFEGTYSGFIEVLSGTNGVINRSFTSTPENITFHTYVEQGDNNFEQSRFNVVEPRIPAVTGSADAEGLLMSADAFTGSSGGNFRWCPQDQDLTGTQTPAFGTWYEWKITGINWSQGTVDAVYVNGQEEFSNVNFCESRSGSPGAYELAGLGGGTFKTYFDSIETETASANSAPSVNSIEYEVGGSWVSSGSLSFNDQVTRVRADITDPDADSISSTSITVEDLYDSNTRFSGVGNDSTSGDYFIFDITDQTLDDSGNWETSVEATDSNGATDSATDGFSLSWGSISVTMSDPSSDISVQQGDTFTVSGSASCSGGECSSEGETTELWVDPKPSDPNSEKVKVDEIEGKMVAGESADFTAKVDSSTGHSHGEDTHTHGETQQNLLERAFSLVNKLL